MDQVAAYQRDHTGDLRQFLDEWKRHIAAKTVQTDAVEGIRLLSIHRSKGLEFPHVLIPFCDWELEDSRTLLWCHVEQQPYARLPLIPVSYSREQLEGTVFQPFADREHQQNVVDNLNLLYVAFTRAKHSLYVYGLRTKPAKTRRKAPAHRSWLVEQCLPTLHARLTDSVLDGLETPASPLHFCWEAPLSSPEAPLSSPEGDIAATLLFPKRSNVSPSGDNRGALGANPFLATYTPVEVPFTSTPADLVKVRQSNDSSRFLAAATRAVSDDAPQDQQRYIDTGLLLHDVLSRVATIDDVPRAFRQLELSGAFASHQEAMRYQHLIEQRMEDPRVAEWFASPQASADGSASKPRWHVYRECSILTPKPPTGGVAEHHRPDRVMTDGRRTVVVDYKFGRPCSDYVEQVRSYMRLLNQMQMPAVEGYLWFVYTGDVVPVKLS
jgi:ATP-dependent exoDNAse (exonuclease V) beta subunit